MAEMIKYREKKYTKRERNGRNNILYERERRWIQIHMILSIVIKTYEERTAYIN